MFKWYSYSPFKVSVQMVCKDHDVSLCNEYCSIYCPSPVTVATTFSASAPISSIAGLSVCSIIVKDRLADLACFGMASSTSLVVAVLLSFSASVSRLLTSLLLTSTGLQPGWVKDLGQNLYAHSSVYHGGHQRYGNGRNATG